MPTLRLLPLALLLILVAPALAEPLGTLVVTSPTGPAQVLVDGAPAGRTPARLTLPPGAHLVRLEREGLQPFEQQVQVQAGAEQPLDARLKLLEGPGQVLYVQGRDRAAVARAWRALVAQSPDLQGPWLLSWPARGWVGLAPKAIEQFPATDGMDVARRLSLEVRAPVLHLAVTPDGKAWYAACERGELVDRYCSDPARDVPDALRLWAGRPEKLLPLCKGRPLSSSRKEVSLTDLHGFLYFYTPELRRSRPAAWRSPAEIMRLLGVVLGTPDPPAPFASHSASAAWTRP